jgi:bacillithiol biosynthesis deacetylase BshB1
MTYGLELLAFGPHPDDVELFCGGLLAKLADGGHRTGIVDLTLGEKSSRGTPQSRAAETEAASRALGLTLRENLGLPDAAIAADGAISRLVEVLRRLRPELVVVPWHSERHPDHEAASALLTRALFFAGVQKVDADAGLAFTPRQVLYYPMRHLAEPTVVIDVTASHERKMTAVRCYQSQVEARPDAPATLVGSALSLSSLVARDQFYGAQIGVGYGEPYVCRETPGLSDPLDHYRRNTFARPLFFPARS